MRDQSALERSYRRLLWAYPRFFRRERGLELLTTLLDAAPPGQVRASRTEAADLIGAGLRYRLVPPGWTAKVAVGVVALWAAVVLGGLGAYLAWGAASADRPDLGAPGLAAQSDALVGWQAAQVHLASLEPLEMAYSYNSYGYLQTFTAEGWTGVRPAPAGHIRVYADIPAASTILDNAYRQLHAEGWQTGSVRHLDSSDSNVFWASHDGLLLRLEATAAGTGSPTVLVGLYQAEPDGVYAAAITGFVIGLVLAWPGLTWLAHRSARSPKTTRRLVLLLAAPVLYACAANSVDTVLSMVPDTGSVLLAADLMYPLANSAANPLAAIVIGVGLVLITGVVTVAAPRRATAGTTIHEQESTA